MHPYRLSQILALQQQTVKMKRGKNEYTTILCIPHCLCAYSRLYRAWRAIMGTFERETGMTDDENTINPHDLLKDGIFQSESAHDPEFDALKEAIPLLNHPLAPQNMQELAFDKAIFDLFVRDIA